MSVVRSAFARRAAVPAACAVASSAPSASRAIHSASRSIRSAFSLYDPSFLWNSSVPSRSIRDSSGTLRSASQKNRASRSRARDDALGVAGDGALVVGLGVDDGEKRVLQLAVLGLDRKVVLMMNQRGRQHFVGQLEELERERAGDDRRVLDQIGHLEQQPGLAVHGPADAALQPLRLRVELARDLVVALAALEDDEVLEQPRAVLVERPHLDRAAGAAAGRQEPVAVGDGAGRHVLHLPGLRRRRARDRERHDAAAVDEEQPANRPPEQQLAAAVFERRVPVHQLRKRDAAQRAAEHGGQHVDRRLAALPPAERQVLAFRRLHALERADLDALLRGEPGGGRRRRPVRLEAGRTPAAR